MLVLLAPMFAVALAAAPADADRRAAALSHELMSPFCPQLLLGDCRSAPAVALRGEIRDALARGTSEAAIRAELVRRFGERILAAPPARGFGLVAWLAPPAALLAAAVLLARRMARRAGPTPATPSSPVDTPALRRRLQEELRGW